jgi:uncharacterized membrane protein
MSNVKAQSSKFKSMSNAKIQISNSEIKAKAEVKVFSLRAG